jgi:cytochrome c oxidase cbb3-type subunit III
MNDKEPQMSGHNYDGISELDNLLPRWWLWLFWLCNVFGLAYLLYFHVLHPEKGSAWEFQREVTAAAALQKAAAPAPTVTTVEAPTADAALVGKGKEIFLKNCIPCHGTLGQGIIGPNLTDDFWIHGGTFAEIKHTITEGVPAKGMITWKLMLKPDDIQNVASFVWSLHGTDVSKAVPPAKVPEPEAKKVERQS